VNHGDSQWCINLLRRAEKNNIRLVRFLRVRNYRRFFLAVKKFFVTAGNPEIFSVGKDFAL
jgi:hypothetical protein